MLWVVVPEKKAQQLRRSAIPHEANTRDIWSPKVVAFRSSIATTRATMLRNSHGPWSLEVKEGIHFGALEYRSICWRMAPFATPKPSTFNRLNWVPQRLLGLLKQILSRESLRRPCRSGPITIHAQPPRCVAPGVPFYSNYEKISNQK